MSDPTKITLPISSAPYIKAGDIVKFDGNGNVVIGVDPAKSQDMIGIVTSVYANQLAHNIEVSLMNGIFTPERVCSYCKVREWQHTTTLGSGVSIMNHPFFLNNLEYLEWESQKKNV